MSKSEKLKKQTKLQNYENAIHSQNLMKLDKCHPLALRCLLVSSYARTGICAGPYIAPHH